MWLRRVFPVKSPSEIAPAVPASVMASELTRLMPGARLVSAGPFDAYVAQAPRIPAILQEIGRQREIAFRAVAEGTGNSIDLDRFDSHYDHLFVWHRERREIAGAYRLARIHEVLRKHGPSGLYLSSQFHLRPQFFRAVGCSLELGRSFVAPQYQKDSPVLLLLWKAIGQYIVRYPECRVLCGPVSMSQSYTVDSREAVYSYFQARREQPLASYVHPRRPLRVRPLRGGMCAVMRLHLVI